MKIKKMELTIHDEIEGFVDVGGIKGAAFEVLLIGCGTIFFYFVQFHFSLFVGEV